MKDSKFKRMDHKVGDNLIFTIGGQVSSGYKPDITIKNKKGETLYILESEKKTDRKAYIGDFIKAEKYAQEIDCSPILIIVMQEFSNTTVKQIADHLHPYLTWISNGFNKNSKIKRIAVMSDQEYIQSCIKSETIGSQIFLNRGIFLSI